LVIRIEYKDDDGNVIVVDPVRELIEHEGGSRGSRSYIYLALQRFMPRAVKDKWKEILQY
jgi:hypothetical protein